MAVNGGRAWPERLSAKLTTANFMWLTGVSPWVLYQDIVTLTQPPVCPLNPETICKGYTSQACKNTDIVQWSLSMPLCSAVTGKERRCDPFFSILVFLAKWYKNQVSNANKGYFLVLFPFTAEHWADTWVKGQAQYAREPVEIWSYSVETNKETGIKNWPCAWLWSPFWAD